jgi:hypothetical protein
VQFVGKKPHTQVALTDKGYRAIEQHWQFLESLRRLGMGLLILTTIIVALISPLPVVLLFFITAKRQPVAPCSCCSTWASSRHCCARDVPR